MLARRRGLGERGGRVGRMPCKSEKLPRQAYATLEANSNILGRLLAARVGLRALQHLHLHLKCGERCK